MIRMLSNFAIGALILGIGALWYLHNVGTISSAQARQLVGDGALLIDVRTTEEYAAGHIAGALNFPVAELTERTAELAKKDKPIVLYCRSGARSARGKTRLERAGFTAVHNLGAMSRWE
jgi:rhodanese-related sulfurtransferase